MEEYQLILETVNSHDCQKIECGLYLQTEELYRMEHAKNKHSDRISVLENLQLIPDASKVTKVKF